MFLLHLTSPVFRMTRIYLTYIMPVAIFIHCLFVFGDGTCLSCFVACLVFSYCLLIVCRLRGFWLGWQACGTFWNISRYSLQRLSVLVMASCPHGDCHILCLLLLPLAYSATMVTTLRRACDISVTSITERNNVAYAYWRQHWFVVVYRGVRVF